MKGSDGENEARMIHIAVIIITYRRYQSLIKLLTELQGQQSGHPGDAFRLTTIIVDNDSDASAAGVPSSPSFDSLNIRYIPEPVQGIPIARNAGLAALPADTDYFCFIDDDEWPGPNWMEELLKTQHATGADCVHGPVIPVYPEKVPKWLVKSRIFESWQFEDQSLLQYASSNNVMISAAFIRRTGLRFEKRMRRTGGSDYLFFKQAVALGLRIVWSSKAHVYGGVQKSRLTLRWVLQRQFRYGNAFYLAERIAGNRTGKFSWALKSIAYIGLGFAMLPAFLFSPYYGMRGIAHLLSNIGVMAALCGYQYQEYSPHRLASDRAGCGKKDLV